MVGVEQLYFLCVTVGRDLETNAFYNGISGHGYVAVTREFYVAGGASLSVGETLLMLLVLLRVIVRAAFLRFEIGVASRLAGHSAAATAPPRRSQRRETSSHGCGDSTGLALKHAGERPLGSELCDVCRLL